MDHYQKYKDTKYLFIDINKELLNGIKPMDLLPNEVKSYFIHNLDYEIVNILKYVHNEPELFDGIYEHNEDLYIVVKYEIKEQNIPWGDKLIVVKEKEDVYILYKFIRRPSLFNSITKKNTYTQQYIFYTSLNMNFYEAKDYSFMIPS